MSEIRANTVSDAAGTGPVTLTGQYAAKAWMNLNGTGTIAIRDSFNVSSVTDNGTGAYTQSFTNALLNGNYCTNATGTHDNGSYVSWGTVANDTPPSTTAFRGDYLNNAGTLVDVSFAQTSSFGDLA